MTGERWQEIRELFEQCLDRPASERANWIAQHAHDPFLADQVHRLLQHHDEADDSFLQPPEAVQKLFEQPGLLHPGTSVTPRFQIIRLIGRGGMGEVYEAYDAELHEPIAIKALRSNQWDEENAFARSVRELRLSRRISHPNVCRVFDFLRYTSPQGELILITMELIAGITLEQRLKDGPIPPILATSIARQLAGGLLAAHEAGVIHRDLKPSNIMLAGDRVVIMDFGVARLDGLLSPATLSLSASLAHSSSLLIGTLSYMAPEQLRGQPATRQSDLYALGLILYEVLCAHKAFASDDSLPGLLRRLEVGPSPMPASPKPLATAIARCLEQSPEHRPQSARELLDLLSSGLPEHAPPPWWAGFRIALVAALCLLILGFSAFWTKRLLSPSPTTAPASADRRFMPFTTLRGSENDPAFSPDGQTVAFVWNEDRGPVGHLFTRRGKDGPLKQITFGPESDTHPAWSSDGRWLAYIRRSGPSGNLMVVPSGGGPARRLVFLPVSHGGIAWSHHGRFLAYTQINFDDAPAQLHLLNFDTGRDTVLPALAPGALGDFDPAFSPDDRRLAFIRFRSQDANEAEIDIVSLDRAMRPNAVPTRLISAVDYMQALIWDTVGRRLIFSSSHIGSPLSLWQVTVPRRKNVPPQREQLTFGQTEATNPSLSPDGHTLAYESDSTTPADISLMDLSSRSPVEDTPCASSRADTTPQLSSNGSKMYFISLRSGANEIWSCDVPTGRAQRLTSFNGPLVGSLRLSPDERQLLFDGVREGRWTIFRLSLTPGSRPIPLVNDPSDSVHPSWSHDGQMVYFSSDRSGTWEIWRQPLHGLRSPVQVTDRGGWESFETADGKTLYFNKRNQEGLWSRSLVAADAPAESVLGFGANGRWSLTRDHLYVLADLPHQPWNYQLMRLRLRDGKLQHVLTLARTACLPFEPSVSVSYNERYFAYAWAETPQRDLMLIENFR